MPTTKVTTKMNSLKHSCIMNVICADETAQTAHALNKRYVYATFDNATGCGENKDAEDK